MDSQQKQTTFKRLIGYIKPYKLALSPQLSA